MEKEWWLGEAICHLVFKCHWRSMSFQEAVHSDPHHIIWSKREIGITNPILFMTVCPRMPYHRPQILPSCAEGRRF